MVSGSWILPSSGKEVGRKKGLLAYYVGSTLETVPKPGTEGPRAAPSAGVLFPLLHPRFPGATSSLLRDQPARLRQTRHLLPDL